MDLLSALRVGVFSEVGHPLAGTGHFSGVSNFLRYNMAWCKTNHVQMDLHAYADRDRLDVDGPLSLYGWKPRVRFKVDPTIPQDGSHFRMDPRILRVAREREYDVLNVVAPGTMGFQGIRIAKRLGLPVLAMYTTCLPEYAGKRSAGAARFMGPLGKPFIEGIEGLGWRLMEYFYSQKNGVSVILAPTGTTAGQVSERLEPRVQILGRGVDTDLFVPAERPRDPGQPPLILFAGRIHRGEKGLDRYIEIAQALPDARFLIVGDGPHRTSLERDLGDRAEFTGALSGAPLGAAYRRADLFVFPSKHDTFGQVVMEAMATGLPVVVTDEGGPQELVDDGVTGFIADDRCFIPRVAELLASPELRERMGRNARLAAERRSWDAVFRRLWCHYAEVAGMSEPKVAA